MKYVVVARLREMVKIPDRVALIPVGIATTTCESDVQIVYSVSVATTRVIGLASLAAKLKP